MASYQTYSFQELAPPRDTGDFTLPVQVLATGFERQSDQGYRWDNQRHRKRRFHILQYTCAGRGLFHWGGGPDEPERQQVLEPGDLFVASWNQPFEYRHPGDNQVWEFRWVILEGSLADEALAHLTLESPVIHLAADSPVPMLIEQFHQRLALGARWNRHSLSSLAYEWLVSLIQERERSHRTRADDTERLASDWVMAHLDSADCPSLARYFGYNNRYFATFLQHHTGLTPQKFIEERKMRYAALLLSSTNRNIGDISRELGYSEDNYFSKVFRMYAGQSPGAYRKAHRDSLVFDQLVTLRPLP